jgi:hypothetical protein
LRPGDTANLGGGETITVNSITIYIGTDQSFMEIEEA